MNIIGIMLLGLGAIFFSVGMAYSVKRNRNVLDREIAVNRAVAELSGRVVVTSTDYMPGKTIQKVLGALTATHAGHLTENLNTSVIEKEARKKLMESAIEMGANGIISYRAEKSYGPKPGNVDKEYEHAVTCRGIAVII